MHDISDVGEGGLRRGEGRGASALAFEPNSYYLARIRQCIQIKW